MTDKQTAGTRPRELALFDTLNRFLTPLARAGVGSPSLIQPAGLVLLEVAGRRSGTVRQTPLVGMLAPGGLLVSTVRGNSQWVRNLAAADEAHAWLWGMRFVVQPTVYLPGEEPSSRGPAILGDALARAATQLNLSIAYLAFVTPGSLSTS